MLLYHHDPSRTDDELDALVAGLSHPGLDAGAAAEGMILDLPWAPLGPARHVVGS